MPDTQELYLELGTVNGLATRAIKVGEVASLDHKLRGRGRGNDRQRVRHIKISEKLRKVQSPSPPRTIQCSNGDDVKWEWCVHAWCSRCAAFVIKRACANDCGCCAYLGNDAMEDGVLEVKGLAALANALLACATAEHVNRCQQMVS